MQQYASPDDMVATFGEDEMIQLSSTRAAPDEISLDAVRGALDYASVQIDGYVASRYPKPFSPVPRLLVGLCCDMARYRLAGTDGRMVTDEMRDRHKDAVSMLKMIARGDVKLGADQLGKVHEFNDGIRIAPGSTGGLRDALKDYPQ